MHITLLFENIAITPMFPLVPLVYRLPDQCKSNSNPTRLARRVSYDSQNFVMTSDSSATNRTEIERAGISSLTSNTKAKTRLSLRADRLSPAMYKLKPSWRPRNRFPYDEAQRAEARRVAYVALTRAMENCHWYGVKKDGGAIGAVPSGRNFVEVTVEK